MARLLLFQVIQSVAILCMIFLIKYQVSGAARLKIGEKCRRDDWCDYGTWLWCHSSTGICDCLHRHRQVFSIKKNRCVSILGSECNVYIGDRDCVENSYCYWFDGKGTCKCKDGFKATTITDSLLSKEIVQCVSNGTQISAATITKTPAPTKAPYIIIRRPSDLSTESTFLFTTNSSGDFSAAVGIGNRLRYTSNPRIPQYEQRRSTPSSADFRAAVGNSRNNHENNSNPLLDLIRFFFGFEN